MEGCIRGWCSAGGGGGGGGLRGGALTASSFTRVKLMHRPCRHTADGRISDSYELKLTSLSCLCFTIQFCSLT